MIGSVTHKSKCDLPSCINYNIWYDVITTDGVVRLVWCAPCNRNITHTAVPV